MTDRDYLVSKAKRLLDGSWVRVRRTSQKSRITGDVAQHTLTAKRKGKSVGSMSVDAKDGYVYSINVTPEMRRKKVATEMWNRAKKARLSPKHTDFRTPDGDAWARSVGGHLPKNNAPKE